MRLQLIACLACSIVPAFAHAQSSTVTLGEWSDALRPVTQITSDSFTLQYFTATPCQTRVRVREGGVQANAWRPEGKQHDPWSDDARVVEGSNDNTTSHRVTITGLQPGKRYYYQVFDPGVTPNDRERHWGARQPWRREYAVSTHAGPGRRTIVRVPVKVLLMPNVLNVASAHGEDGSVAPMPEKLSASDLQMLRDEYATASRYFFINSNCRLWVDFHIVVDDRWQRWGDEPANAAEPYKGWPVSRSYAGKDFDPPGGGTWTIVDVNDPQRVTNDPVFEPLPFAGQVEQCFARKWNPKEKKWTWYGSGGGTYGVDRYWEGVPARSQFLGGGDTAWLTAHEVHHQLESLGAFSLADREDDRIIFNHPDPRFIRKGEGDKVDRNDWSTTGPRQGEQWDVMAWSDRLLSDAQWLRMYFGETVVTADADDDGVPDDDARLPFDEKRFGSDPTKPMTDGAMNDRQKLMLSIWAPAPLQSSFTKPREWMSVRPDPTKPDTDGDGLPDTIDPRPLYPWQPFVWPITATVDGDTREWRDVPLAGEMRRGGITLAFRQAHDDDAYYGLLTIGGGESWKKVELVMDGEGLGAFSKVGEYHLEVVRNGDGKVEMRAPRKHQQVKLAWKAGKDDAGNDVVEFSLPNGKAENDWHWRRGGRDVGVSIEAHDRDGRIYTMYEPYVLFYAKMLEPPGRVED